MNYESWVTSLDEGVTNTYQKYTQLIIHASKLFLHHNDQTKLENYKLQPTKKLGNGNGD